MPSPHPSDPADRLPILARILDRQLRALEHAPHRRRQPSAAEMLKRAKMLSDILRSFEALIASDESPPPPMSPEEEDREREELRREIDRIIAEANEDANTDPDQAAGGP